MSLLEELKKGKNDTYKDMSHGDFVNNLESFMNQQIKHETKRRFDVFTGTAGMKIITEQMDRLATIGSIDSLSERGLIDLREKDMMKEMVMSPDQDNMSVVKAIIEEKEK